MFPMIFLTYIAAIFHQTQPPSHIFNLMSSTGAMPQLAQHTSTASTDSAELVLIIIFATLFAAGHLAAENVALQDNCIVSYCIYCYPFQLFRRGLGGWLSLVLDGRPVKPRSI